MKIVVLSDTHGNIARIKHVMGFTKEIHAAAVIHCGDWDDAASVRTTLEYKIPLYSVLGNADVDPEIEKILKSESTKFDRELVVFAKAERKIAVCHYPGQLKEEMGRKKFDIGFHGHTHKRKDETYEGMTIINPGAVSRTDKPSFVVYDVNKNTVEFVDIESQ